MVDYHTEIVSSIKKINKKQWNDLIGKNNPFIHYEFLKALEVSKSIGLKTGWLPNYIVSFKNNKLVGAIPLYKKYNSLGEYIFDWQWVGLYEHVGLDYFPKFTIAIPFTPATGKRILIAEQENYNDVANALVSCLMKEAERQNIRSIHWLFVTKEECEWLTKKNFFPRYTYQFHWNNDNYRDFDHFLEKFKSKKRNQVKKERRIANEIQIEVVTGKDLQIKHWQSMYLFYLSTIGKKWAHPYLTKDFFEYIAANFSKYVVMIFAKNKEKYIAGALNFCKEKNMYGRYWGCIEEHNNLHFEVCYYKSIEYCIENKIQLYEAGAQGYHKVHRGYLPKYTYSAHWIQQPELSKVIVEFVTEENARTHQEIKQIEKSSPFKIQNKDTKS